MENSGFSVHDCLKKVHTKTWELYHILAQLDSVQNEIGICEIKY